jgi:signal transduction histidine kinase
MTETIDRVAYRELEAERDRLIAALRSERGRLEAAFQNAPTFFAIMRGVVHEIVYANDAFFRMIGRREIVGRTVADALPEVVEQGVLGLLDRVFSTGQPFAASAVSILLARDPAGSPDQRFVDFVYYPYLEDGRRAGVILNGYDVTEMVRARKDMERLLEESVAAQAQAQRERELATSVLESMNDCYFALDRDYRLVSINRAMERATARDRDTMLGRLYSETFPDTVGTEFETQYARAMHERVDVHFTGRFPAGDDELVVEADAYPTNDGGIAVFWRDVTAQVEAQVALAESEVRFRAVQDASPHGSTLYRPVRDEQGTIVDFEFLYLNPAGATLSGFPAHQLVGRRLLDVFPHAMSNAVFERYVKAIEAGTVEEWESRDMRPGVNLGVHFIAVPVGDMLHVRYIDITERMRQETEREELLEAARRSFAEARAAEERLRDVFEQTPIAVAVLSGPDHVYTIVSPRYAETPGNGRPLLGRSVRDAFPELAGTAFFEIMDRVYETGVPFNAFERRVMLDDRQDGTLHEHFFNIGYQPLRDGAGAVYAVASVAYDVTEQIHARHQVDAARAAAERAQEEAEKANKAKGEFLAIMSHELRTPLNAIGGYAELIDIGIHGPVTDAQRGALARIQQSQRHLLGLINGVLNYSRVEAGALTYELTRIPVVEAVAEAESLVAPQLRAKGLQYGWHGCAEDLTVTADREKLQQILLNLLSNAIKFTDARNGDPGRIEISCDALGAMVAIHVRDTGEGIPPDKLRAVFEPFVQIDQRLTRRKQGVGLGLTISRDLARGMGGDLTAESTVGEGSTFTLTLPAGQYASRTADDSRP